MEELPLPRHRIVHRAGRVVSLCALFVMSLASLSIGLNANDKSIEDKQRVMDSVPPPTVLTLDTNDLHTVAALMTVVSGFIALSCFIYCLGMIGHPLWVPGPTSTRMQSIVLSIYTLLLLGTQIAITLFVATRGVKVTATLNGIRVPDGVVETIERATGQKTAYKDFHYLILLAIVPWLTIVFTAIAAAVAFCSIHDPRKKKKKPINEKQRQRASVASRNQVVYPTNTPV